MKVALPIAILLLTAVAAEAQPVSGFYVQGSTGITLPQQQSVSLPPGVASNSPNSAAAADAAINSQTGASQGGSTGWGFGNGFRMEVEGVHSAQGGGATN